MEVEIETVFTEVGGGNGMAFIDRKKGGLR